MKQEMMTIQKEKWYERILRWFRRGLKKSKESRRTEELEMILFDLDGTLWETTDITLENANEVLRKHNINYEITEETVANTMGCNFSETAEKYMPTLDENMRLDLLKEMCNSLSEKLAKSKDHSYPNLEQVLIELKKKYKLAIVSNCADGYIESFLESSGLGGYFEDFAAASKMKIPKGEAIKCVMERNNIKKAIYVGDTLKDYEASQMAGIEFIHAKYGFAQNLNFKYFINKISELPKLMENIEKCK